MAAQTHPTQEMQVTVSNPLKSDRSDVPVVISLRDLPVSVATALVTHNGQEIPCQLDDLNHDGRFDELCFLTDLKKKEKQTFDILLADEGKPREYPAEVYVEMMLSNKKIKESNKQDLYISHLTVENGVNAYWMIHHHGTAFESKKVGYRIYFDHRQTVDIYGKYHEGLELKDTQFYPDAEQKAKGYGDDVLWVGSTFGVGALRGWDGKKPTMLEDVAHRSQRLIARGPLRTIVEVKDEGWTPQPGMQPITMTTLYILYAGHRDCAVEVSFDRPATGYQFATGIINVKNSTEYSDQKGLRGCWGTDWPVSEKDSAGHKRETVGLGIRIPQQYVVDELPVNKDNYGYVVATADNQLKYDIVFGSDNEDFGFHSAETWYAYLQMWKRELEAPVLINVQRK
jgi:hypothetical protein